ncbi:MAG: type II 3-dehydroquinate dehydratase [Myxococcota bacterium]
MTPLPTIAVIQGANLNLLGTREPALYGRQTLQSLHDALQQRFAAQCLFHFVHSNHEGALIDAVHTCRDKAIGIVINPGAYTHTSYALADAIVGVGLPCVEVHVTNVYQRESFRHKSCIAPACVGSIIGLGTYGYTLAAQALLHQLDQDNAP